MSKDEYSYTNQYVAQNSAVAKKAKRRKLIGGIAGGLGAFLATGGAVWAAVALTSNEATATLEKGSVAELKITDADFTGPLYPGMSTGLEFKVENDNPFPATIKQIVISGSSTTTCNPAQLTGAVDIGSVSGLTVTLAAPVEVAPGTTKTVTYANALKLSKDATDSCTAVAKFKVAGSGAGN